MSRPTVPTTCECPAFRMAHADEPRGGFLHIAGEPGCCAQPVAQPLRTITTLMPGGVLFTQTVNRSAQPAIRAQVAEGLMEQGFFMAHQWVSASGATRKEYFVRDSDGALATVTIADAR